MSILDVVGFIAGLLLLAFVAWRGMSQRAIYVCTVITIAAAIAPFLSERVAFVPAGLVALATVIAIIKRARRTA